MNIPIPRGLISAEPSHIAQYNRQIELAFKSISSQIGALGTGGVTPQQLFALQQQVTRLQQLYTTLQSQIEAISDGAQAPIIETFLHNGDVTQGMAVYEFSPGYVAPTQPLSVGSATLGILVSVNESSANVCTFGDIQKDFWSWTAGYLVFADSDGQLTQTAPVSGYIIPVGYAVSTDTIRVLVGPAILISATEATTALTLLNGAMVHAPLPVAADPEVYVDGAPARLDYTTVMGSPGLYIESVTVL